MCDSCCDTLGKIVKAYADALPSTVRLVRTIVQAQLERDNARVRNFAYFVSALLRRALEVLAGFTAAFAEKETDSANCVYILSPKLQVKGFFPYAREA